MRIFLSVLFFLSVFIAFTQGGDSLGKLNMQVFTQASILQKGAWEYKAFNQIYTQTKGYSDFGVQGNLGLRNTFFTSIHQVLYGVHNRWNLGVDLWVKSSRNQGLNDSFLEVLSFSDDSVSRAALAGIGPKVRFLPFGRYRPFAIQSTWMLPVADNMESRGLTSSYLSEDAHIWFTQFMGNWMLNTDLQAFVQLAPWVYIPTRDEAVTFATPLSLSLNYFVSTRATIYTHLEYWKNWNGLGGSGYFFVQNGVGLRYQVIPNRFELEISTTKFILGRSTGAGTTLNFGLRLIRL